MSFEPLKTLFIPALVMSALSGCYYYDCPTTTDARYYQDPAYVTVDVAPPQVRAAVAVRPPQPAGAVWVAGHFAWRGSWVWVDGHWETPRQGYVWTAPSAVRVGGAYRYHPGYWRPAQAQPAPAYRANATGRVAVSVRPRTVQPRVTTVQQAGGTQTVSVQTSGGANPAPPPPPPPPTTTVRVRGGTNTATANPNTGGAVNVTVREPATTPRTTVRVRGGGTTTTTTTNPNTGGAANVRVRVPATAPRTTVRVQGTGTTTTANPNTGGAANVRVRQPATTPRTVTRVQGGGTTTTNPNTGGAANVRVRQPGMTTTGPAAQLTCRLQINRAPRGGYINVRGTGFARGATVRIGGNIAVVSRVTGGSLRAQVPSSSNGGHVSVEVGGRRTRCGTLQIIGR